MRLIDADELGEHKFPTPLTESYQQGWNDAIDAIVDNAPTIKPDTNCSNCDYFKFSQSFIENVVKFMTDYNIKTVEDLMKELNHINDLLGGRQ